MISSLPPNTNPSSTLLQNKRQNPSYTQKREVSNGQPINDVLLIWDNSNQQHIIDPQISITTHDD